MDKKTIDQIIESAGYGITVPVDKKERFLMRRLVEHAYRIGIKDGLDDADRISSIIGEWANDNK